MTMRSFPAAKTSSARFCTTDPPAASMIKSEAAINSRNGRYGGGFSKFDKNSRALFSVRLVTPAMSTARLPVPTALSSACPIAPQPTIPIDFNGMIANVPDLIDYGELDCEYLLVISVNFLL